MTITTHIVVLYVRGVQFGRGEGTKSHNRYCGLIRESHVQKSL